MKWNKRNWPHIFWLCPVAFVVGVAIGAFVLSDPIVDDWLHKWQTLSAGTLALIGAFWTVRKIQRQIDLTRWEHGQGEISRILNEKKRFKLEVSPTSHEFGSLDRFIMGITGNESSDQIFQKKVQSAFNWLTGIDEFEFDPTIGGTAINRAREKLEDGIRESRHDLQKGMEEIKQIHIIDPIEVNQPSDIEDVEGRKIQFGRAVFKTDGPKCWKRGHMRAIETKGTYLTALDNRVEEIRNKYGQID